MYNINLVGIATFQLGKADGLLATLLLTSFHMGNDATIRNMTFLFFDRF